MGAAITFNNSVVAQVALKFWKTEAKIRYKLSSERCSKT
jgi:hypothetical protein